MQGPDSASEEQPGGMLALLLSPLHAKCYLWCHIWPGEVIQNCCTPPRLFGVPTESEAGKFPRARAPVSAPRSRNRLPA